MAKNHRINTTSDLIKDLATNGEKIFYFDVKTPSENGKNTTTRIATNSIIETFNFWKEKHDSVIADKIASHFDGKEESRVEVGSQLSILSDNYNILNADRFDNYLSFYISDDATRYKYLQCVIMSDNGRDGFETIKEYVSTGVKQYMMDAKNHVKAENNTNPSNDYSISFATSCDGKDFEGTFITFSSSNENASRALSNIVLNDMNLVETMHDKDIDKDM